MINISVELTELGQFLSQILLLKWDDPNMCVIPYLQEYLQEWSTNHIYTNMCVIPYIQEYLQEWSTNHIYTNMCVIPYLQEYLQEWSTKHIYKNDLQKEIMYKM